MQNIDGKKENRIAGKWNVIIRTRGEDLSLLREALYSVSIQDYPDRSVILIYHPDPKESDGEVKKIEKKLKGLIRTLSYILECKLIRVTDPEAPRGAPLNLGLQNVDGEYVSFLDYDDIYYPSMGAELIGALNEDLNAHIAYGNSMVVSQHRAHVPYGESVDENYLYNRKIFKGYGEEFNSLKFLFDNYIPLNTYVVRVSDLNSLEFDEGLDVAEDWDFLLNLIYEQGLRIKYIDFNVSEYRKRDDLTHSFSTYTKKKRRNSKKRIYKKIEGRNYQISGTEVNDVRSHFMPDPDAEDYVPPPPFMPHTVGLALRIIRHYFIWKFRNAWRILVNDGPVQLGRSILYKFKRIIKKSSKLL